MAASSPMKVVKKVAKKPEHPPVADMVKTALKELKDRKGSSLAAIKKHIAANNKVSDVSKLAPFIKKFLKKAVEDGKLLQVKGTGASGSFKINKAAEEKPKKPKAAPKKKVEPKKKPAKKDAPKKKKAVTPKKKAAAPKKAAASKKASKPKAEKPKAKKAPAKPKVEKKAAKPKTAKPKKPAPKKAAKK